MNGYKDLIQSMLLAGFTVSDVRKVVQARQDLSLERAINVIKERQAANLELIMGNDFQSLPSRENRYTRINNAQFCAN